MSKPVQKVNENTYVIGSKTYLFGKCKTYLKKDLRDILTILGVSYKTKDTNAILCELIEASLKIKFSKAAQAVQMAQAAQAIQAEASASSSSSSSPTPVVVPQALAVLLPNKLVYKGKTYDMKDCKKAFRDVKKEDLQHIGQILGITYSAKATKEKMCDELRKASHKAVQQVVQMQIPPPLASPPPPPPPPLPPAAPTPSSSSSPKSKIHVDGAPISLKDCASFDLPLLKALAKAVGTTYSKDKAVVCQRIQKKYKGAPLSLYSKDFTTSTKTTKKAPTPKAPTPKAPTPKQLTPKQLTALEGLVYDTDTDSVVVAGHTFYMGRCEKYRAYKIADLQAMATALAIPFKGKKETGKTLCHKIEQLLLTLKPEKTKSPTPTKTPTPSPPKTPAAAALLPSPVKAMTAEEIREAVRKCLNLSK
jgi:hypothetical protein